MKINIGSKNPVKIEAVREIFSLFFDDVDVKGLSVDSGISNQPKTREEIMKGARNRAINCFQDCDYSVGLESGIFPENDSLSGYFNTCGCAIYDGKEIGRGWSPGFEYPPFVIEKIFQENLEVNQIFDDMLGSENIGQKQGAVGILASNKYSRKEFTKAGIMMALFPLLNKNIYAK